MKKAIGKRSNLITGAFGEEVTAKFLLNRGDEILDRNWRIREGSEI
jgi:putative endonuclease